MEILDAQLSNEWINTLPRIQYVPHEVPPSSSRTPHPAVGTLPGLGGGTLGEGWRPPNVPPWSGRGRCGAWIFLLVTFLSECKILII